MSGPFRKAIDEIAIRAAENGGPSAQDLLTAMIAGHDEAEQTASELALVNKSTAAQLAQELKTQHQESLTAIDENKKLLMHHFEEAFIRDERIAKLEAYKEDSERTCAERVKSYIDTEHGKRHSEHLATMHLIDEEDIDIKKLYRTLKWAAIVLGGGILLILADQLGNLIFGGAT